MARRPSRRKTRFSDYRHPSESRTNNPPAQMAAEGHVPAQPKAKYAYSPRRPPTLRFDPEGTPDKLRDLLAEAAHRKLTEDEVKTLAEALDASGASGGPWLEWAEKRERDAAGGVEVDPVALHIHERLSAQAILNAAARKDVERSLFADPQQEYHEAVRFYKHRVDWSNRLILGDSLQVMSSLEKREDLAGKVQMIYLDPPYGIKFASNFQPEVGRRDVKDTEQDLTREPEMVKAYRDTWRLGIHSYLSYLRDRLVVARELLADSGSIFVQISDENLHRVRQVMDEVLGAENFCTLIVVWKTSSATSTIAATTCDYLLWYANDRANVKYRQPFTLKDPQDEESGSREYKHLLLPTGEMKPVASSSNSELDDGERFRPSPTTSQSGSETSRQPVTVEGREFVPGSGGWKTNAVGFSRLINSGRIMTRDKSISYVRKLNDFPVVPVTDLWTDCRWGFDASEKRYVVETNPAVIQRCLLMTTDPGDLVLDPTCGSGTTAAVAERWGRRWITIDTSRVAIALARQRLLTGKYEMFKVRSGTGFQPVNEEGDHGQDARATVGTDPHPGFVYKEVPHITLGSIARNEHLDPIFEKHEPILDEKLAACNKALGGMGADLRAKLAGKLAAKMQDEGVKAATDADRRRWLLPSTTREQVKAAFAPHKKLTAAQAKKAIDAIPAGEAGAEGGGWEHWEVPFDTDPGWPSTLQRAVEEYRAAWRTKMDEVNACIASNAESEQLVDQPEKVPGVVRVSGPFTVEAVQPPDLSLGETVARSDDPAFAGAPEELEAFHADGEPAREMRRVEPRPDMEVQNVEAYLDQMVRLLRTDGVRFPDNRQMAFSRLEPIYADAGAAGFHAEGRWAPEAGGNGNGRGRPEDRDDEPEGPATVAVVFGPQYGPITAKMVEQMVKPAQRMYDDLVFAGFSFDAAAQQVIREANNPRLRLHAAHIRPDVNPAMEGLLKEQPGSQLFTVFGEPRVAVEKAGDDGDYMVRMEGVDLYNPVENTVRSAGAEKVAAWMLDSDYDGRTFCATQVFFPDRKAWEKLSKALKGVVDEGAFEALSGTESLPFPPGEHKRVAVKVIDPRGNEVMRVEGLS